MSLKSIGKLLACAAILALIGLTVWNYQCRNLYEKQKIEISAIVENLVREQANKNMLLPPIVLINPDSVDTRKMKDILVQQLSKTIAARYLRTDSVAFSSLEISPVLSSPFLRDKKGQFYISEAQAESFKTNVDFLVRQTDAQVANVKEEIGRDIDRLNLWVSIWIGIIGFLGVLIPIVLNFDAFGKLERINKKAEDAKTSSESAIQKIEAAKPQIDKIDGLEKKVTDAEKTILQLNQDIELAQSKAEAANRTSKEAEKNTNTLHLVYAVDRLELLNIYQFKEVEKKKLLQYLEGVFTQIHTDLKACACHCQEAIVKNTVTEFALRLEQVSHSKLIDADITGNLIAFAQLISDLIKDYNPEGHEKVVIGLGKLIDTCNGKSKLLEAVA